MTEQEIEIERRAFIEANHKNLDLIEDQDAWGRPKFKHSHIEAMWEGWKQRATNSR